MVALEHLDDVETACTRLLGQEIFGHKNNKMMKCPLFLSNLVSSTCSVHLSLFFLLSPIQ